MHAHVYINDSLRESRTFKMRLDGSLRKFFNGVVVFTLATVYSQGREHIELSGGWGGGGQGHGRVSLTDYYFWWARRCTRGGVSYGLLPLGGPRYPDPDPILART